MLFSCCTKSPAREFFVILFREQVADTLQLVVSVCEADVFIVTVSRLCGKSEKMLGEECQNNFS